MPVFQRLAHADALALVEAAPQPGRLAHALETARCLWAAQAMQHARLVTRLLGNDGAMTWVHSIPTPTGYLLLLRRAGADDLHLHAPRRMYVHEFPRFICDSQWCRADSFLAFPLDIARTLPIPLCGEPDLVIWTDSRLGTTAPAHATIQLHARFFVNFRTGRPTRQRGRRARRWTKVITRTVSQNGPTPCPATGSLPDRPASGSAQTRGPTLQPAG